MRDLEDENNRLKQVVADLTLDREMLQDVINTKGSGSGWMTIQGQVSMNVWIKISLEL